MGLSGAQRALLGVWLPGAEVVADHSWGVIGTTVLELDRRGERFIAKAEDAAGHHLAREIEAHERWLAPWTSMGRAPRLLEADRDTKLLVTAYLPGALVQGHPAEHRPATYRQAGELLAALHAQSASSDPAYERRELDGTVAILAKPHRIPPDLVRRSLDLLRTQPAGPAVLVPTHGDWQPRNWLIHEGEVRIIDFGRAALRPPASDLLRMPTRQWARDPALEQAFVEGYGSDPRDPERWRVQRLQSAIATAVWAFQVGDEPFEREGVDELTSLLDER